MGTVYMIRHGSTAFNSGPAREEKVRGWMDVPLEHQGLQEAAEIGKSLAGAGLAEIHSSNLQRTARTAQIVAAHTGAQLAPPSQSFRPWNLGNLQGGPVGRAQDFIRAHVQRPTVPIMGGESFLSFVSRFRPALRDLLTRSDELGKPIGLVTHYRNVQLARSLAPADGMRIDLPTFLHHGEQQTGSATILDNSSGHWRLSDG